MSNIGYAFDLHDTLVFSSAAWDKAFTKSVSEENKKSLSLLLKNKVSRKQIAKLFQLDFVEIEESYREGLTINPKVFNLILQLKAVYYPVLLISNAKLHRVNADLDRLNLVELFDKVYTFEDGKKPDYSYINNIITEQQLDLLIMVGNNEQEDVFHHPKVLNLLIQDLHVRTDNNEPNRVLS
ncbi:HAD family hydrolase [Paenibacillus wynnii]|uniref:Haloacid dehalogenase n=1 Tax=Paenibacillus wynnii TaxID=268407 RepID=A0A098M2G7_9BACL|nr:HAD hydrolase-like protein [Paenibacillus wynnii]KGE16524.1 hypothetical protein PWYN_17500 [Paenibacillus wynnii]